MAIVKNIIKSTTKKAARKPAAAGGGKKPPSNGKKFVTRKARDKEFSISKGLYDGRAMPQQDYDKLMANRKRISQSKNKGSTTGGALFRQEGASVRGKSRLAENPDLLAGGSGRRRKVAQRMEGEDIVENPVPKGQGSAMKDVREGRAGKITGGSEDNVMVNTAGKRTGMQREMVKTQKRIAANEEKLKKLQSQLKTSKQGKKVVDIVRAEKLSDDIAKVQETLKLDKEKLGGKKGMQRRSPPLTKKASGGKIMKKVTKKANGGRMSRVALSPAEEARAGVLSEAARRRAMPRGTRIAYRAGGGVVGSGKIMQGYKKGGQV